MGIKRRYSTITDIVAENAPNPSQENPAFRTAAA
jgi:hypothetical protein